jgi:hypothetical protein
MGIPIRIANPRWSVGRTIGQWGPDWSVVRIAESGGPGRIRLCNPNVSRLRHAQKIEPHSQPPYHSVGYR